eukprot:6489481-Amphidinium_carterae.1
MLTAWLEKALDVPSASHFCLDCNCDYIKKYVSKQKRIDGKYCENLQSEGQQTIRVNSKPGASAFNNSAASGMPWVSTVGTNNCSFSLNCAANPSASKDNAGYTNGVKAMRGVQLQSQFSKIANSVAKHWFETCEASMRIAPRPFSRRCTLLMYTVAKPFMSACMASNSRAHFSKSGACTRNGLSTQTLQGKSARQWVIISDTCLHEEWPLNADAAREISQENKHVVNFIFLTRRTSQTPPKPQTIKVTKK